MIYVWRTVCCLALLLCWSAIAEACPSCKAANNTDSRLPMAYQASILFMLAVPAMIGTGFVVGLYRMNRAQEEATRAFENGDVWYEEA